MNYKLMLSAKDVMEITGLDRCRVYQLLNRDDMPVIKLGKRKYMHRDLFFGWLASNAKAGVQ